MTVRLRHGKKADLNAYTFQALGSVFSLTGVAATFKKAWRMVVPDKIPYLLTGQAATLTPNLEPSWTAVPSISFQQNGTPQTFPLTPYVPLFNPSLHQFQVVSGTLPTGVTLNTATGYEYNGTGAAASPTSLVIQVVDRAAVDWANRIQGAGVVWYHTFDAAAEVNQFRWTGDVGQDPNNVGNNAFHMASGGADGGGFMRLTYPANAAPTSCYWWRPFNPLTGTGNGRGSSDPGANGTLTPVNFTVSQGSSTLNSWAVNQSNPGWYGPASAQAANPGLFQGGEFWLQIRVRRAQTPGPPPDGGGYTNINGKFVWFTTTLETASTQEIVNYGQSANQDVVGVQSYHNAYTLASGNFVPINSQPGGTVTIDNTVAKWRYSGGWDTLLIHVTPGTAGGTGANRTRYEVWAQHDPTLYPTESGVYTKIWDVLWVQGYSSYNSTNGVSRDGWNAMLCAIYHNGTTFPSEFHYDYDQIIFSKANIAAPTI